MDGAPDPSLVHINGKCGHKCRSEHHPSPCDYRHREDGPCSYYVVEDDRLTQEQLESRDKTRQVEMERMAEELVVLKGKQVDFDQMSSEMAEMRKMIRSINRGNPVPPDPSLRSIASSQSDILPSVPQQQQSSTPGLGESQVSGAGLGVDSLLRDVTAHIEKNTTPASSIQSRGDYTGGTMNDLRKEDDLDKIAAKVLAVLENRIPQIRTQQVGQSCVQTNVTASLPARPTPSLGPNYGASHAAYNAILSGGAEGGHSAVGPHVPGGAPGSGGGILLPEDQFLDAAAIMNKCTVSNRRQLRPYEFARMGRFSYASKITEKNITVPLYVLGYLQYVVAMLKNVAPTNSETEVVDRLINLMTIMEITANNSTLEDFKCPGWSIGLEYASRIFHDIEYGRLQWENLADGLQPHTFLYAKDTVEMQQQQNRGRGGGGRGEQPPRGGGRGRGGRGRGGGEGQRSDDAKKVCMSYNGFWTGSGCAYEYSNDRKCGYEHYCSSCFEKTGVKEKHKAYYCDPAAVKTPITGSGGTAAVTSG